MFSAITVGLIVVGIPNNYFKVGAEKRRAHELVPKLGNDIFRVREEASRELTALGSSAIEALELGIKHSDMEIHERCRKLLPRAMQLHLGEEVDRFLAKPTGTLPKDLPGLKRWLQIVGRDKEGLELYREVVKKHAEILIDLETSPDRLPEIYGNFLQRFNLVIQRPGGARIIPNALEVNDLALLLFMGSDPECRRGTSSSTLVNIFFQNQQMTQFFSSEQSSVPIKKLFASWLEQETTPVVLYRATRVVADCQITECAPAMLKMSGNAGLNASYRSSALISLLKIGSKKMVDDPQFQKLLTDQTVIRGGPNTTEMRDVALGVAVELTGQNWADYGFERAQSVNKKILPNYLAFSFISPEKRESAHKQWKEWSENRAKK